MTERDELWNALYAARSWMEAYAKSIEFRNPGESLHFDGPLRSDIRRVQAEMDKLNSPAVPSEPLDLASIPREELEAFYKAHNAKFDQAL